MDAKKVWAFIVMGGNRPDNINLFLGGFNDYKKARKCVSEMAGVYMFIEIVDREGQKLGFINNKFMWH